MNPTSYNDIYKYGEKILNTIRKNYSLRSSTRCATYSDSTRINGKKHINAIGEEIMADRQQLGKFHLPRVEYFGRLLKKKTSETRVGNCGEFADIAEVIANLNAKDGYNCFHAGLYSRKAGMAVTDAKNVDHAMVILVNDKTADAIRKFFNAKDKAKAFPKLNNKNTVVIDPWGDFIGNIQQAKENYKTYFSNAFIAPSKARFLIVPDEPLDLSKHDLNILGQKHPNLIIKDTSKSDKGFSFKNLFSKWLG